MPTINDAIVASGSGYTTSGNGGRKLVKLDSGALVAATKDATSQFVWKTTDNWNTKTVIASGTTYTSSQDVALCTDGKNIFRLFGYDNSTIVFNSWTESGVRLTSLNLDTSQTALGNVSLTINEAKTELHAAWASKNSTYPNSFNIRYAKGTINSDGTVTWGAVEQITMMSINSYPNFAITPSIVLMNNNPYITIAQEVGTFDGASFKSDHAITLLFKGTSNNTYLNPSWNFSKIREGNGYFQHSPSAICVPQSINGLANGLIANVWHGLDATHTTTNYIRFSKSTDGGTTWSTMQKLVPGTNASLTANKAGKLFITYEDAGVVKHIESSNNGDTWSSAITIGAGTNPSTLFDLSVSFSAPLTIRKGSSSVLFSGSWVEESISPPIGERGQILNRQNILTYNITSDSTIGTVTEKINGVVVGTKTLNSGQNTTINITQAQWDAIPYGKFRNNSAGRNTIEIVTSNSTFIYTFVKWLDNTVDILSSTKAVKDSKDYYLPSAKKILSDAINSKGGSTTPTDSIENMANQVASGSGVKFKEGTSISTAVLESFTNGAGAIITAYSITLDFSVLGFVPKNIIYFNNLKSTQTANTYISEKYYINGNNYADVLTTSTNGNSAIHLRAIIDNQTIKLPVNQQFATIKWIAYE